jgi:hypothetical protein
VTAHSTSLRCADTPHALKRETETDEFYLGAITQCPNSTDVSEEYVASTFSSEIYAKTETLNKIIRIVD